MSSWSDLLKEENERSGRKDKIDHLYDGHHDGYTYMGGGYYQHDKFTGSDMYVIEDEYGRKEYFTDM